MTLKLSYQTKAAERETQRGKVQEADRQTDRNHEWTTESEGSGSHLRKCGRESKLKYVEWKVKGQNEKIRESVRENNLSWGEGEEKRETARGIGGGEDGQEVVIARWRRLRLQRSCTSHLLVISWPPIQACLFIIDWDHALYFTPYMCDNTSGQHLKSLITSVNTHMHMHTLRGNITQLTHAVGLSGSGSKTIKFNFCERPLMQPQGRVL